jgi:Tol biopolymer transport system component
MMRALSIQAIAIMLVTAFAPRAIVGQTDVRLRVTTEGRLLIRIGFLEPDKPPEGALAEYRALFMKTLTADLEMSGYFEIVQDVAKDEPNAAVKAAVSSDAGDASFDIDLRDRPSDNSIFRRRYGASAGRIAGVAHMVADDIVYALTGRMGIADTRLAFVAGEKGQSRLYSVHIDGSQLVAFEGMNATPEWSPDGKSLALTLSKDGNPEIYVISLDGKARTRLTTFSGIDCSPTWAPNGVQLAFTSDRTGSPQIFITDLEGSPPRRITYEGSYNTSPAWSPEGDLIAFVSRIDGRFQICTIDPFGVTTNILTEEGNNEHPGWSPDGMHIVFSSTAGGNSGIYIMNRDGSGKRRVFNGLRNARDASWTMEPRRATTQTLEG